jgi:hypothetical protein
VLTTPEQGAIVTTENLLRPDPEIQDWLQAACDEEDGDSIVRVEITESQREAAEFWDYYGITNREVEEWSEGCCCGMRVETRYRVVQSFGWSATFLRFEMVGDICNAVYQINGD